MEGYHRKNASQVVEPKMDSKIEFTFTRLHFFHFGHRKMKFKQHEMKPNTLGTMCMFENMFLTAFFIKKAVSKKLILFGKS